LDTWFSSGLFPFSTMGWPEMTDDLEAFFPGSVLETGHDILFFWVARMVMMSLGLLGKLPFHTVYLHAMVRDAHGRKMSKSLGNVIDPLEVVEGISLDDLQKKLEEGNLPEKEVLKAKEGQRRDFPNGIPECGADALRFGLLAYTCQGRNVNLNINRVVGYRHFCNKIWNATRFGLTYFGEDFRFGGLVDLRGLAWEDKWILSRLSVCAEKSNTAFEQYEFAAVTTATYAFFQYELCDVYLELLKPRFYGEAKDQSIVDDRKMAREVLYVCLDSAFRLMHPLLPYLTEELYQRLPPSETKCESITIAAYPTPVEAWRNTTIEAQMEVVAEIAKHFRSQKTSLGLLPNARPNAYVKHSDSENRQMLVPLAARISRMSTMGAIEILREDAPLPVGTVSELSTKSVPSSRRLPVWIFRKSMLQRKMTSAQKTLASYDAKTGMPGHDKVPTDVRQVHSQKLDAEYEELLRAVAIIEAAMK